MSVQVVLGRGRTSSFTNLRPSDIRLTKRGDPRLNLAVAIFFDLRTAHNFTGADHLGTALFGASAAPKGQHQSYGLGGEEHSTPTTPTSNGTCIGQRPGSAARP
jgi:hypothetical protein